MKKYFLLAFCLLVMATGVFALDMTVGVGGLFNYSTTYGKWEDISDNLEWSLSRMGYGGYAFFGFNRFFEFNLGLLYKEANKVTYKGGSTGGGTDDASDWGTALAVQFGVYFKYPFNISERLVIFPTIGIDYEFSLADASKGWWDDLWLRGGAGLDVFLTERIFLRGHIIYGAAFPMRGAKEDNLYLTHGFLGKLGVGWMF